MIKELTNEDLRDLARAWADEAQGDYDVDHGLKDLEELGQSNYGEVFVLYHKDMIVGALGITLLDTFFCAQNYAAVRYWYIKPSYRYLAKGLLDRARLWAKNMGCPKIMVCSNVESAKAGPFYEKMGFEVYETVYIGDV